MQKSMTLNGRNAYAVTGNQKVICRVQCSAYVHDGQKSQLLILSEFITATEKMKHCLTFSCEIFYVIIVFTKILCFLLILHILQLRKHDVINVRGIEY